MVLFLFYVEGRIYYRRFPVPVFYVENKKRGKHSLVSVIANYANFDRNTAQNCVLKLDSDMALVDMMKKVPTH